MMVWKVEEERLVDITKTLDKVMVGLLFGGVFVFSAVAVLAQKLDQFPNWAGVFGMALSLALVTTMMIMGVYLNYRREEVYQRWLKRRTTGRLGVRTHAGVISSCKRIEIASVQGGIVAHDTCYDVEVDIYSKVGGKARFEGVRPIKPFGDDSPEVAEATDSMSAEAASMSAETVSRPIAPKVGDHVRIVVVANYNKHGRELLRKTTLYRSVVD